MKNQKSKIIKFTVITLFPDFVKTLENYSVIGRAIREKKIGLNSINLRDFGLGRYKQVDDKPYGGGPGMLFRVDVVAPAIKAARQIAGKNSKVYLLTPEGIQFSQKIAKKMTSLENIILVCGHYEGFDKRIETYIDEKISIGNFVLSGGEIPAMTVIDAVSRLIPSVIKERSLQEESFVFGKSPEYPQYTRPEAYEGKKVPKVLLSGDPKMINKWQGSKYK